MAGVKYDECRTRSFIASGVIGKNKFVKLSASDTVVVCDGADDAIGITVTDNLASGDQISVLLFGDVYTAVAGSGGVTYSDYLVLDSSGQKVIATTLAYAGTTMKKVLGRALQSKAADKTVEFVMEKVVYQA